MTPAEMMMFQALTAGGGMYGNVTEPNFFPFGNSGFLGANPMLGFAAQALLPGMFGSQGLFMGQFAPQQNLYDQFRARQYQNDRMAALMAGGQGDRQTYVRMMRGVAQMAGTPFGIDQLRAANTIAGDAAAVMPFLAPMAPEFFDQLHGTRGSQAVMAMMLHRGGFSAVDPVTGLSGLSGASSGAFAKEMYSRLYGPGADLGAMRGMGAGQAGAMYAELQTRGLLGPSIGTMGQSEQAKALGMTEKQLSELGSPRLDEARRNFDARQAADRIKNLAGAVSAMKDIFGDMGHPDAPMAELVSALDNLTQGGLSRMPAGKLEQTVRHSYEIAKQTGMGMQAFTGLMTGGAALADRFGVDRAFALSATQGAALFGAAYGDVGGGNVAAFGRLNKDEYTILDQRLRLAAAGSGQANQYGALFRYAREVGGLKGPAKALMEAIQRGDDTYTWNGQQRSTYLEQNGLINVMQESGVDSNTTMAFLRNAAANKGDIYNNKLDDYTRRNGQPREAANYFAMHFQSAIAGQLASRGIDSSKARSLADKAARTVGGQILSLDAESMSDANRAGTLGKLIQQTLAGDVPLTEEQARRMASIGWSQIEEGAANGQFGNYKSGIAIYDAQNKRTLARVARRDAEARADTMMTTALAGLGRAGPLARLADMLQAPPGSAAQALGQFLGGVPGEELAQRMGGVPIAALEKRLGVLAEAGGPALAAAQDPEKMVGLIKALTETQTAFHDAKARGAGPAELQQLASQATALISGGPEAENHIKQILASQGLSRDELDEVLAGNRPQVPQAIRDRLVGLKLAAGTGLAGMADRTGVSVGAKFGANDLADAQVAGGRLHTLLKKGKLSEKEQADAKRYAKFSLTQGGNIAGMVLADDATLKAAGQGAVERAKKVREGLIQMKALAAEKGGGKSVEELLATGDPKDPAVKQLREMHAQFQTDLADLHKGFTDTKHKADEHDLAAAKKYREETAGDAGSQLEQNKAILKRIVETSGAQLSSAEMEKIAKEMGTGEQGEIARTRLNNALKTERFSGQKAANAKDKAREPEILGALMRLGSTAAGGEGTSEGVTAGALRDFIKAGQGDQADDTGKKDKITVTGELTLKDPHGVILTATSTGGSGSTPVATGDWS